MKFLTLLLLACASPLSAQLPLTRLSSAIQFDGSPNDAAWDNIPELPLTMYTPVYKGTPSQRTVIKVAYDDAYFYAAGWFYDTDPKNIRINSLYRDRWNGDDAFAIYLDVFNDNRNAKWFGITPSGMRFETLLSEDGDKSNSSWDTFWDAATTMTNEGWFVEVRIPFSSLGFHADDGRVVMGMTVTRQISRNNERVTFPAIDPKNSFRQPSVAAKVSLDGVTASTPLYVTPYALQSTKNSDVGLDVRYPITSELTLDATANTDFAQVEADDQQVNLDRFTLFFPEKRRFFQERSDIFDFDMGGGNRLFHSRQIGLSASVPVPVKVGGRAVGRIGGWDVGVMDMLTEENFGVARVKRRYLNNYSEIGGLFTARTGLGNENYAYGLDSNIRMFGSDYLQLRFAQTFDNAEAANANSANVNSANISFNDRSQYFVNWTRRASRGLYYSMTADRAGEAYNPELGFVTRRDFTTFSAVSQYFFFTNKNKYFSRVFPGVLASSTSRNQDGSVESGVYAFWLQWDTKAGGGGWLEPKYFIEDVRQPFRIGKSIEIPVGRYEFADFQAVFRMPAGQRLRTSIDARAGTYFDGRRQQLITNSTWNASRHIELGVDYQVTRLQFPARDQAEDIQLARLRVGTALNVHASGNAFLQYNSTTDQLALNARLRYNFAEGTDLWLVYDNGAAGRSLVLKYTHTFRL